MQSYGLFERKGLCRESNAREGEQPGNPYPKQLSNCPGTSLRPVVVPAGMGGNRHTVPAPATSLKPSCRGFLCETNVHSTCTMGWISSLPWEMQLGLQRCYRTPNRSHRKVSGVSSVCLGVLQGAKEKLCISRQALIFHIQSSTSSVIWPLPLQISSSGTLAFVSPLRFSVRKHLNQDKV